MSGGPDGGGPPMGTEVKEDKFTVLLGETSSFTVPNFLLSMIKQIDNHGNHIISLSQMCRWLGQQVFHHTSELMDMLLTRSHAHAQRALTALATG